LFCHCLAIVLPELRWGWGAGAHLS
jgi:hypothetical protein